MASSTDNSQPTSGSTIGVDSDGYPQGYDPLCASCGYLNWIYGPDDGELLTHIDTHTNHSSANLNNNSPAN